MGVSNAGPVSWSVAKGSLFVALVLNLCCCEYGGSRDTEETVPVSTGFICSSEASSS